MSLPDRRHPDPVIQRLLDWLRGVHKKPLLLAAGWAAAAGDESPTYSRFGRLVILQGSATKTAGVPAGGDVIGTLPDELRPAGQLPFPVLTQNGDVVGGVLVQANGNIVWRTGSVAETDSTSLSGICFTI